MPDEMKAEKVMPGKAMIEAAGAIDSHADSHAGASCCCSARPAPRARQPDAPTKPSAAGNEAAGNCCCG